MAGEPTLGGISSVTGGGLFVSGLVLKNSGVSFWEVIRLLLRNLAGFQRSRRTPEHPYAYAAALGIMSRSRSAAAQGTIGSETEKREFDFQSLSGADGTSWEATTRRRELAIG
jgi:hypothetical protein